ncbi:hypothetical protein DFH28DRAFT_1120011 [Melampsora americana]|nr:hypothetical protein DFH28DRAFT_1120011 [Melampsora americana]
MTTLKDHQVLRKKIEVDLEQDSKHKHSKVKVSKKRKKAQDDNENDIDKADFYDIKDYFEDPLQGKGDWCGNMVCAGGGYTSNLKAHRDGPTQDGKSGQPGCKNHEASIAADCNLPLTIAGQRKA